MPPKSLKKTTPGPGSKRGARANRGTPREAAAARNQNPPHLEAAVEEETVVKAEEALKVEKGVKVDENKAEPRTDSEPERQLQTNPEPEPEPEPVVEPNLGQKSDANGFVSAKNKSVLTKTTNVRGVGFSVDEDRLLIDSWLDTSIDRIHGNEQKSGTFWHRIGETYHLKKTFNIERSDRMLQQRWTKIQATVNKFCGCFATINSRYQSGINDQDTIAQAKKLFQQINGSKFTLDHAWIHLRYHPKWIQLQDDFAHKSSSKRIKNDHVKYSSSSNPSEPINIDESDHSFATNIERPPGRKAAKRKMGASHSGESTATVDLFKQMMEEKRVRDEKELEILKKKMKYDEKKLEFKKLQMEMSIMSMDTSQLSEEQKMYYSHMRMKILQRVVGGNN